MNSRDSLPPIKFTELAEALLARVDTLVPSWLSGGVQRGHEWVCGSLSGGSGTSCSVNLESGAWADFAADQRGGDLVSLYAAIHEMPMGKAAVQLAREEGLEDVAGVQPARRGSSSEPHRPTPAPPPPKQAPPKNDEGWRTVAPVPASAPGATFRNQYRVAEDIEHTAEYLIDGALYGYVVRFKTSDGGKEPLPYTWCTSARDGASRWHWKQWDEPRPLYFPGGISPASARNPNDPAPSIILVEGEKKAGILHNLLHSAMPGIYLVASWPGGCKAWKKAQWQWLAGCTVMLWPDCDGKREPLTKKEREACLDDAARDIAQASKPILPLEKQPGMAAMVGIGGLLRDVHRCSVQMLPIPDPLAVIDGWDCADAIQTDGWDSARVLDLLGRAQPLVGVDPTSAAKRPSDDPVGTDAPDSGDDGVTVISGRRIPGWLVPYYDKANKRWLTSRKLVILILQRDPALEAVLGYNELSNMVQARTEFPWEHAQAGPMQEADSLLLGNYLSDTYGLPSISKSALEEAIQTVAYTRRFHPIREQLQSRKWDGKTRIDKWLLHVLGETPESLTRAMREYLQIVGRCWLLGMVNRVMRPGCKFDYCPVLEGAGGLRKSTMVEILAGTEFYSDTPFEVGRGKEAQEQVQGLWLYEIAEMTHFSKSEVGAIKAFITSKVDRYRVAYGSTVGSFGRQCVLVGTTNENTYLRDRTGNRRFWPIPVRYIINTEWLIKYREQLLAEAYSLFLEGAEYTPSPEVERRLFVPIQESRLVETAVQSELLYLLTRMPATTGIAAVINSLTDFVTIAQLTLALGVDAAKSSPALEAQIRGWLDHEGWERVKKQINGARAWGYVRPRDWPPLDDSNDMDAPPGAANESTEQDNDDAPF